MEIDIMRPQEFRGRKIPKRAEALGIDGLRFMNQFLDEFRDAMRATPSTDVAGNFIDDAESEHGGVPRTQRDRISHGGFGFVAERFGIEKATVFPPRNVDEDLQAMFLREIQEPVRWHVIDTQSVGAQFTNLRE